MYVLIDKTNMPVPETNIVNPSLMTPVSPPTASNKLQKYVIIAFITVAIISLGLFLVYLQYSKRNIRSNSPQTPQPTIETNTASFPLPTVASDSAPMRNEVIEMYACTPDGRCTMYSNPVESTLCPIAFIEKDCQGKCADPANRCEQ